MHPIRSTYPIWARLVTVVFIGVLCFIAVSTTHMAYAGEPTKQDAVSATSTIGISSADLDADELSAALDSYLSRNVDCTHEPGVAVALLRAKGLRICARLERAKVLVTLFYIGSLSKSMCAVAIVQLVEQGKIDLDAPASDYAPDTPHISRGQRSNVAQSDKRVRVLRKSSLNEATVGDSFGEFSYANANYDLLGRIVEHVSGESYSAYMAKHVFAPLNMVDSSAQGLRTNDVLGEYDSNTFGGINDDDPDVASIYSDSRNVLGHRNYFGRYVQDDFQHAENDDAWGGPSSGYVSASIRDMANYLQMYLAGGKNVLDYDSIMQMFMSRVPDPDGDSYYGMGWTSYDYDGELVFCHDGDVETNVASMAILPDRDIGVVVLGDGYDSVAGNSLFFNLANGVLDVAMGNNAVDLDETEYDEAHAEANAEWVHFWLMCALPLLFVPVWCCAARLLVRKTGKTVVLAAAIADIALFACVFVWATDFPRSMGTPWRDVSTFDPSIALGLYIGFGLFVAAAVARIVSATIIACRRRKQQNHAPE